MKIVAPSMEKKTEIQILGSYVNPGKRKKTRYGRNFPNWYTGIVREKEV